MGLPFVSCTPSLLTQGICPPPDSLSVAAGVSLLTAGLWVAVLLAARVLGVAAVVAVVLRVPVLRVRLGNLPVVRPVAF